MRLHISDDMCKGDENLRKLLSEGHLNDNYHLDGLPAPGLTLSVCQQSYQVSEELRQEWLNKGYISRVGSGGRNSINECCVCDRAGVLLHEHVCSSCDHKARLEDALPPIHSMLRCLMENHYVIGYGPNDYWLVQRNSHESRIPLGDVASFIQALQALGLVRVKEPGVEMARTWEAVPDEEYKPPQSKPPEE